MSAKFTQAKLIPSLEATTKPGEPLLFLDTNADKLALEDINPGQFVVIAEENRRLEVYLGGGSDNEDNWKPVSLG